MNDGVTFVTQRSRQILGDLGGSLGGRGPKPGLVNAWFSCLNTDVHVPDGVT